MHQKNKLAFHMLLIDFGWNIERFVSYLFMTGIMCKTRFWTTVNVFWAIVAVVQTCESLVSDVRTIPKSRTNTNIIFSWVMSRPCSCNAFVVVLYYGQTLFVFYCIDLLFIFWNLPNSKVISDVLFDTWPGQGPSGRDRDHLAGTRTRRGCPRTRFMTIFGSHVHPHISSIGYMKVY